MQAGPNFDIDEIEVCTRLLREAVNDYIKVQDNVKDENARKELLDMILTNARCLKLAPLYQKRPTGIEFDVKERGRVIYDMYDKYLDMSDGNITPDQRKAFGDMILNNARLLNPDIDDQEDT
jgi:hypothetical protein